MNDQTKTPVKEYFVPLLAAILTSIFPVMFLYCQNSDEASFLEIAPIIGIYALLGTVVLGISLTAVKSPGVAGIIASVFSFVLTNYLLFENILKYFFHHLRYWHCVVIVFIIVGHASFLIKKYLPKQIHNDIVNLICIVFAGLIVLNFAMAMPSLIKKFSLRINAQKESLEFDDLYQLNEGERKPNIYLFIFDEYANFPQMEEYYNYDNEPLMSFLTENNFSISYTSHNESYMTPTVTTNLVNLDYIVTDQTDTNEKQTLRHQGKLFSIMREHGYEVDILESFNFFGGHLPEETNTNKEASTMDGETLKDLCFKQTVIYPFWSTDHSALVENALKITDYLSNPESLPDSNTFTLVYINLPHAPFVVDEDGKSVPITQSANWGDKQYYLGQYKYTTKIMLKMLQTIVDNDPNSIIILQSDHGARGGAQEGFRIIIPYEVKTNPLNALYVGKESSLTIEGLSSVNTLRTVLNYLWNESYEMLPLPHQAQE